MGGSTGTEQALALTESALMPVPGRLPAMLETTQGTYIATLASAQASARLMYDEAEVASGMVAYLLQTSPC